MLWYDMKRYIDYRVDETRKVDDGYHHQHRSTKLHGRPFWMHKRPRIGAHEIPYDFNLPAKSYGIWNFPRGNEKMHYIMQPFNGQKWLMLYELSSKKTIFNALLNGECKIQKFSNSIFVSIWNAYCSNSSLTALVYSAQPEIGGPRDTLVK